MRSELSSLIMMGALLAGQEFLHRAKGEEVLEAQEIRIVNSDAMCLVRLGALDGAASLDFLDEDGVSRAELGIVPGCLGYSLVLRDAAGESSVQLSAAPKGPFAEAIVGQDDGARAWLSASGARAEVAARATAQEDVSLKSGEGQSTLTAATSEAVFQLGGEGPRANISFWQPIDASLVEPILSVRRVGVATPVERR